MWPQVCAEPGAPLCPQTDHLAQQLRLAEARAATAEEAQQRQQQEVAFLKRATELAAEQLTKSAGAEVPATLLVALARVRAGLAMQPCVSACCRQMSHVQLLHVPALAYIQAWFDACAMLLSLLQAQEEGVAMSVQLADSRQQLAQMASALQHARAHLLEQQKVQPGDVGGMCMWAFEHESVPMLVNCPCAATPLLQVALAGMGRPAPCFSSHAAVPGAVARGELPGGTGRCGGAAGAASRARGGERAAPYCGGAEAAGAGLAVARGSCRPRLSI